MTNSDTPQTQESLLQQIDDSWNDLQNYLTSQPQEKITKLTDDEGWSAKDHAIHVAMWEKSALATLEGKSKREAMDIAPEIWEQDDDPINAVIQQRYKDMPLDEVIATMQSHHNTILTKLKAMTEADYQLPYHHYQPHSTTENPIIEVLYWDTINHYDEHLTWIKAIIE